MRHSLKILLVIAIAAFLAGCGLFLFNTPHDAIFFCAIGLCLLGVIILFYLSRRILVFRKRIVQILRMLISGDYEVDLRHRKRFKDEIDTTSEFIEKFLEQLRTYEDLRIERISLLSRTLELLFDSTREGLILIDLDKNVFKCNSASRELFRVKEDTYTLKSMASQDENRRLMQMFMDVTEKKKIAQEGKVTVQLPVKSIKREVYMKVVPLKDKKEKVRRALGFISLTQARPERR